MKKSRKNIISLSLLMICLVSCATSITGTSSSVNNSKDTSASSVVSSNDRITSFFESDANNDSLSSDIQSPSSQESIVSNENPNTFIPSSSSIESVSSLTSSNGSSSQDIYYTSLQVSSSSSITSGLVTSSSSSSTLISSSEIISSSEEEIPEPTISFNGIYKGVLNDGDINYKINNSNIVTIEITDTTIKINNLSATIVEYDNYYGYTLMLNDKTFSLSCVDYDDEKALTLTLSDEENDYYIESAYRIDQVVTIPNSYVGTFSGELNDGDVEITLNGTNRLTVKITSNSITINNIKADLLSFDEDYGFELLLNGVKYNLVNDTYYDGVNVLNFSDYYNNYYCDLVVRNGFVIE